jgi:hypothetical protein
LETEKHTHTGPKSDLEQFRGELMVVVEKIKAVDCANTAVAQKKLQESYNKYTSLRSGYSHIIDAIDQQGANFSREWLQVESRFDELAAFFVTNGKRPSRSFSQGSCEEVVALFNEASLGSDLDQFFTKRRGSMDGQEADLIEREKAYTELSSELTEYESILDKAIADSKNKRSALDNLYIIVLILVVMSVGSIAMIRIFPYNLMREWIESGQVIQFVTVTIILIVIVVLGLTGLLSENSLGTLLGAIGGYVLSQGVGRAAAMNAKKKEQENHTKPSEESTEESASKEG